MIKTVEWTNEGVRMLDQRLLPTEEKYLMLRSYEEVADAIKKMVVRGAPAIGISAAMGLALGASQSVGTSVADLEYDFKFMCKVMEATRPTAVNLFWAVERMRGALLKAKTDTNDVEEIKKRLVSEALAIFNEDIESNRALGKFGGELIADGATVLTHCNAGALATAGDYGTALGVIRGAIDAGKRVAVIADETRPFLQGSRLTAWELAQDKIPVTVITDNMAGHVMKQGKIDCVVVGADRIAANGDAANKIGTYMVAVLAKQHNIPFYVAAPISTIDLKTPTGEDIPIEQRGAKEVTHIGNHQLSMSPPMSSLPRSLPIVVSLGPLILKASAIWRRRVPRTRPRAGAVALWHPTSTCKTSLYHTTCPKSSRLLLMIGRLRAKSANFGRAIPRYGRIAAKTSGLGGWISSPSNKEMSGVSLTLRQK